MTLQSVEVASRQTNRHKQTNNRRVSYNLFGEITTAYII